MTELQKIFNIKIDIAANKTKKIGVPFVQAFNANIAPFYLLNILQVCAVLCSSLAHRHQITLSSKIIKESKPKIKVSLL